MNLDSHTIDFTCPNCGQKFNETIGRLKQNPEISCPHCGMLIAVKADQLAQGLKSVEESLDQLRAAFAKLGKR